MAFCGQCGKQLDSDSLFCCYCGAPVPDSKNTSSLPQYERKEMYSGVVHKCPRCGTVIDSFVVKCPGCGHEIRTEDALSTVKLLALKLEAVESQRKKPTVKESIASAFFGELTDSDPIYSKKATIISSYPIPNTKEEILEFVVLASSNIHPEAIAGATTSEDTESRQLYKKMAVEQNAWLSKMEQAYKKAQLSFSEDPVYEQVKQICEKKTQEIKDIKMKNRRNSVLVGMIILAFCLLLIIGGIALLNQSENSEKKEKQKEIERLESIVEEIEEDIREEDYSAAKRKAQRLHYDGPGDDQGKLQKSWDETREGYLKEIEKLEENQS